MKTSGTLPPGAAGHQGSGPGGEAPSSWLLANLDLLVIVVGVVIYLRSKA